MNTATETGHTAVVSADDFHVYQRKGNGYWTREAMECLVDALDGTPVVITVDRQTGHSEVGVKLVKVAPYGFDGSWGVVVERVLSNGETQQTNFRLFNIGETIVPLTTGSSARWDALGLFRDRGHAFPRR